MMGDPGSFRVCEQVCWNNFHATYLAECVTSQKIWSRILFIAVALMGMFFFFLLISRILYPTGRRIVLKTCMITVEKYGSARRNIVQEEKMVRFVFNWATLEACPVLGYPPFFFFLSVTCPELAVKERK